MIGIIIGIIGIILAVVIFIIDFLKSKKSDEKLDQALRKIVELGKQGEVIQLKTIPDDTPNSQLKTNSIIPTEPSVELKSPSYDLSTLTTTTDPEIKNLFDYGLTIFGKETIESIIDTVFGEDDAPYYCTKCGASVYSDEKYCSNCGVILDDEE